VRVFFLILAVLATMTISSVQANSKHTEIPKAYSNQKQAKSHYYITQDGPIIVKLLNSKEEKTKSREEEKARNEQQMINWGLVIGNFMLVIINLRQVKITRDASARQLRAYVSIHRGVLLVRSERDFEIKIVIRNGGQTPAYRVIHQAHADLREYPLKSYDEKVNLVFPDKESILGPNDEKMTLTIPMKIEMNDKDRSNIAEGRMAFYVRGEIQYRDIDGKACFFKYHRVLQGPFKANNRLSLTEKPDEAN
jgi:hypothetical protein